MNIDDLEEYFPRINEPIICEPYTFRVVLNNSTENEFVINLKITQRDTKEDKHIKFKFGIGKDKKTDSVTHAPHKPHFEIDLSKREEDTFSARLYFTFEEVEEEKLMNYCKGTLVIIERILKSFFETNKLDVKQLETILYGDSIIDELSEFESILIEALANCYKKHELIIRNDETTEVIKTPRNLQKYLDYPELQPLFLPLAKEIEKK
jgi:hypothetical protein